jgi:hypothetical protein
MPRLGRKAVVRDQPSVLRGRAAGGLEAHPSASSGQAFRCEGRTENGAPKVNNPGLLADFFAPGFHGFFHEGHELVGDGAVDEAVVVAQR